MPRRIVGGAIVALGLLLSPAKVLAGPGPTVDEIRTVIPKYITALEAKGSRAHVFNAKRVQKFLDTHPKAAQGMFMGYKPEWDKLLGWQASKADKSLQELQQKLANANKIGFPSDNKSFAEYDLAWRRTEGNATYHLKTYCTGKTDKTCAKVEAIRAEAVKKVVAGWKHGMKTPQITFDALQDVVIDGEREALYKTHVALDSWIPQLAQEKAAYWRGFLKPHGGLAKYSKQQGKHICQPAKLKYLYKLGQTVQVQCQFTPPPIKFTRNKPDYWRVDIRWAGRWEQLLTYPAGRPSRKSSVRFKLKTNALAQAIKERMGKTSFKYPGNWLRAQVSYITPYIKGYRWVKGVRTPVWKHGNVVGTSFFVRWKR